MWPDGSCDPDPFAQAMRCFKVAGIALADLGASLRDVVRTRMYLLDASDWEAVGRAHSAYFEAVRPAATMVVVAGLLDPALARRGRGRGGRSAGLTGGLEELPLSSGGRTSARAADPSTGAPSGRPTS